MLKDSIRKQLRERFFCTPKTGLNFSGVLINSDRNYLVFADVQVHPAGDAQPQPAPGELYIEKSNVAYVQLIASVNG